MGNTTAAIILAAGYSSRMGDFKPLLRLGETTILERIIGLFRETGVEDIRVVIGYRSADLLPLVDRLLARPVINDRYHDGMFSSVLAGVESLEEDIGAFFLLPVDIPLVRRETVTTLLEIYRSGAGSILYPVFRGKRGHPPLMSARYIEEIVGWEGDGGLKSFLALHEAEAVNVETGDENILLDMDTPSDYERVLDAWRRA